MIWEELLVFFHMKNKFLEKDTDKEKDNNRIVEVLQKGYEMNGRVIRAAKVKVAHFTNSIA